MNSSEYHDAEFFIRLGEWLRNCRIPVTRKLIQGHFGVSRATAYRWHRAWKDATGQI
jgi:hypothetical protein